MKGNRLGMECEVGKRCPQGLCLVKGAGCLNRKSLLTQLLGDASVQHLSPDQPVFPFSHVNELRTPGPGSGRNQATRMHVF